MARRLLSLLLCLAALEPAVAADARERLWLARAYWRHSFDAAVERTVALDVDGDGWSEIGVVTADRRLSLLDLAGRMRWAHALPSAQVVPLPVDLDGDGRSEIVVGIGGVTNMLIALDDNGDELWRRTFRSRIGPQAAVPLSGANSVGILVGLSSQVLMIDAEGRTLWSFQPKGAATAVLVETLDRGGRTVILIGTGTLGPSHQEIVIHALGENGEVLWVSDPLRVSLFGSVEDLEIAEPGGDGRRELLAIVRRTNQVELCRFSTTGRHRWCKPVDGQVSAGIRSFSVAQRDLAVVPAAWLQVFDGEGRLAWSYGKADRLVPRFVSRELLDVDGDGRGEIVAIFERWSPDFATHILAFAPGGRVVRRWSFSGNSHLAHELSLPQGPAILTGAGRLRLLVTREGVRAFSSLSREGLALVGDYNHDGAMEGFLAEGAMLSLYGLPGGVQPATPQGIWQAELPARPAPVVAALDSRGWIAVAGGLDGLFQEELARVSDLRLVSPLGEVVWSRRDRGQVNDLWLGPPGQDGISQVYAVSNPIGVLSSSRLFRHVAGSGELLALDRQGTSLWRVPLPGPPSALTGFADRTGCLQGLAVGLVGEPARGSPGVAAFDPAGHLKWRVAAPGPVLRVQAFGEGIVAAGEVRDKGGFLLGIRFDGTLGWKRGLAAEPAVLGGADLNGDGRSEVLVGAGRSQDEPLLQCFDPDGARQWELGSRGEATALAFGDIDGDGTNEAVIGSRGGAGQGQIHAVNGRGRLVLAVGLPSVPAAVAVAPASRGTSAAIVAALQPESGTARLLVLDFQGRILWSHELGGTAIAVVPWFQQQVGGGVSYVTAEGRFGLVASTFRPSPLIVAPEVGLEGGERTAFVIPTGREARVTLQVWRDWLGAWEDLDSRQTTAETSVRLRWPTQPFGLRDLGRPARFRFQLRDPDHSTQTSAVVAAARLPLRWSYLQRTGTTALALLVLLAGPAGALLYRRSRRRGPRYRDILLCAAAAKDAVEVEVKLTSGIRSLSYRRSLADEGVGQGAVAELARGHMDADRVRDLRDLLQHLLFNAAAREMVFQSRLPTRLRLDLTQAPRLTTLPWELLQWQERVPGRGLHENLVVLRSMRVEGKKPVLPVIRPPLRILLVSPGASEDHVAELNGIGSALEDLRRRRKVEWRILSGPQAEFERIGPELTQGYDIFHFAGHGILKAGKVCLQFADRYGDPVPIEMAQLRELFLRTERSTRLPWLIFLNHCHSAAGGFISSASASNLFGPRRILALITMQQEILGDAAQLFAVSFYRTLVESCRIDHAAAQGRRSIMGLAEGEHDLRSVDWIRPTVLTCLEDGRAFEWD